MGQILHGNATTTEAIRRAIQNSPKSLMALSKPHSFLGGLPYALEVAEMIVVGNC